MSEFERMGRLFDSFEGCGVICEKFESIFVEPGFYKKSRFPIRP